MRAILLNLSGKLEDVRKGLFTNCVTNFRWVGGQQRRYYCKVWGWSKNSEKYVTVPCKESRLFETFLYKSAIFIRLKKYLKVT